MIEKIFEWLFAAILVLILLPCIVSIVVHTLGPVLLTVALIALFVGVYRSLDRIGPRRSKPSEGAGRERTPILPRGED